MDNLRKIVDNYCKQYVKTNLDAMQFMNYYDPDLKERYSEVDFDDSSTFMELLSQWVWLDSPDYVIDKVVEHLYEFYYDNKPY